MPTKLVQPKTKVFSITHTSEDGSEYIGQFTTKKLSVADISKIGMRKSQLGGGMYTVYDDNGNPTGQGLDENTDYINAMFAHLEVALIQKPEWFDLNTLDDLDLVTKVFKEVMAFENTFRKSKNGTGSNLPKSGNGSDTGSETSGSNQSPQQNVVSLSKTVVDEKVLAALDA